MNIEESPLIVLLGFVVEDTAKDVREATDRITLAVLEIKSWDYGIHYIGVLGGGLEGTLQLNVAIWFTLNDDISTEIRNFATRFKELLSHKNYSGGELIHLQTLCPEEVGDLKDMLKQSQGDSRIVH